MTRNPYLCGNYAPVSEERTVTELLVTGSIPEHLDGRYLRNGPNPISDVDPAAYHWFVGDGMVHGVRLRDGRAEWYRNRWVRSPAAATALGETRPRKRGPGAAGLGANTNVIGHAGRTLALVEAGIANYELTEELDTLTACDFDGTLTGGYTAHPKRDPVTGELHAVSYHFGRGNTVQYSVIGTDGRARRTVDVEVGGSPMMHDFALTEHHVVFYDLPVTFDPRKGAQVTAPGWLRGPARMVLSSLAGRVRVPDPIVAMTLGTRRGRNGDLPYSWNPDYPARIGVMSRHGDGTDVRWFEIEPCYVFHTLGAYDHGDTVVCDVVRHRTMFVDDVHGPDEGPPTLCRWTVDLAADTVGESDLDDRPQEFPRADERLLGRPHRYGYALQTAAESGVIASDAVLRHDFRSGTTTRRRLGPGAQGGEFVFVPTKHDAAEDDGVLMGFVYHPDTDHSTLTLLGAAGLEPLAEVHLPARVPHGFHGNWLPAA